MTEPAPAPAPDPPPDPTPTPPFPPEEEGGAPEIKDPEALWKSREKYRHENSSLKKQLDEAHANLEKTRKAQMSEHEKALDEAYKRGTAEATENYQRALLSERILRHATGKLADPTDAEALLDTSGIDPNKPEQIDQAIADLLKAKPHLAVTNGRGRIDQGPQGGRTPEPEQSGSEWLRQIAGQR